MKTKIIDIDPCKPNPCKQNGTCAASSANGTGGFTCSCPIGYQNSTTCDVCKYYYSIIVYYRSSFISLKF